MRKLILLTLFVLVALKVSARAGGVAPLLPIEKINDKAQLIVKVTALSIEKAEPKSLLAGRFSGPVEAVTRFNVVSVLKGDLKANDEFDFHHRSSPQNYPLIISGSTGAIYEFVPGRSYLLWVTRDADKWSSLELYGAAFAFGNNGALLAPDDAPVTGDIKQIVWQQMNALLESKKRADVLKGISYLAHMMQRTGQHDVDHSGDFKNADVAHAIEPLLKSDDAKIAEFAANALKPTPDPEFVTGASIGF